MVLCVLSLFSQKAVNEYDQCKPSVCSPYPMCKTPNTGAYSAEWMGFKKSELSCNHVTFPKTKNRGYFRILKFWDDQDKIDLKNLGIGIFLSSPGVRNHL